MGPPGQNARHCADMEDAEPIRKLDLQSVESITKFLLAFIEWDKFRYMKGIRYQLTRDSNMESVLRFCNYGNSSFRTPCHFPVILSHLFQYPGCQKWPFPYLFDKKNSLLVFIESAAPKGPRLDTISCIQIDFGTNIAVVGDSKSFSCSSHVIFCTFVTFISGP